jgi:methylphosphotriester-DNA--protein-cysteine methyltransferase
MSTMTDTFARFVDVLATTLDDDDASGEALASRLHLSRFHFDRLVSAAAGEPPGTLRRRVLLERAAYRLITTDHDVLGVALDAGEISVDGIDDHPTLRSLLARLVGQLEMWDAAVHDRPYDFDVERNESVFEMRARLARSGPAFLTQVQAVIDEGRLDETFVDAICDPPEVFTYGGMIAHVLTFAAHRRTLVLGALADAGITDLGSGDPMRWVAEAA